MDAPRSLIAYTALVCIAAIVLLPKGYQSWPTSSASSRSTQQPNGLIVQQSQTRPNQWASFGLFPSGPGQANAQLIPAFARSSNPDQAVALSDRIRRQTNNTSATTANKKRKKKKPSNKNKGNKTIIAECLAAHNKMRRLHDVPDLQWDDKLAAFAQKRSNHIAASDGKEFGHPPDLPFGENLFWHSSLEKGCEYMVKGWYDEIDLYDFKAPTFAPATGHFTQMIWRGTQKVGCAFTPSTGPRGGLYLTCNYDPPGNWVGEFETNVPKPASSVGRGLSAPTVKPPTPVATTTTTTSTTARPTTTTTTTTTTSTTPTTTAALASTTAAPQADKQPAETTKPKSKKKKNKKGKKKGDKDKKKKKSNKKKGKKKKTTTTSTTVAPTSTTKAPAS